MDQSGTTTRCCLRSGRLLRPKDRQHELGQSTIRQHRGQSHLERWESPTRPNHCPNRADDGQSLALWGHGVPGDFRLCFRFALHVCQLQILSSEVS